VTFNGRFHRLKDVSIVPAPVQRPIPIWFGGSSDAVVTRAARLGDGWMPIMAPDGEAEQKLGALREQLKSFGRDSANFGIEAWLRMHSPDLQAWAAAVDGWRRLGADMVMLYPMYRITNVEDHIETLRRFKARKWIVIARHSVAVYWRKVGEAVREDSPISPNTNPQ
jgi:alkanesulfonate monooxygenase SsuD/methylene tetrahydromethanopterin reductase-like flavin-dependent oxidoreductase (luciferase family)